MSAAKHAVKSLRIRPPTAAEVNKKLLSAEPDEHLKFTKVGDDVALFYAESPIKVATITKGSERVLWVGPDAFSRADGRSYGHDDRRTISADPLHVERARRFSARDLAAREEVRRRNEEYAAREDVALTHKIFDRFERMSLEERRAYLVRHTGLEQMRMIAQWLNH